MKFSLDKFYLSYDVLKELTNVGLSINNLKKLDILIQKAEPKMIEKVKQFKFDSEDTDEDKQKKLIEELSVIEIDYDPLDIKLEEQLKLTYKAYLLIKYLFGEE